MEIKFSPTTTSASHFISPLLTFAQVQFSNSFHGGKKGVDLESKSSSGCALKRLWFTLML